MKSGLRAELWPVFRFEHQRLRQVSAQNGLGAANGCLERIERASGPDFCSPV